MEEIIHLKAELEVVRRQREEDRDEMEELRDRADNLKVQAQSKLVYTCILYIYCSHYSISGPEGKKFE